MSTSFLQQSPDGVAGQHRQPEQLASTLGLQQPPDGVARQHRQPEQFAGAQGLQQPPDGVARQHWQPEQFAVPLRVEQHLHFVTRSLGSIDSLVYVDVRHNQLAAVPSFSSEQLGRYLGLEGNPLCENGNLPNLNGVEGMCTKQCTGLIVQVFGWENYGCDDNDYTYLYVKTANAPFSFIY